MATLQGTVKDANGNFARRLVRAHRRSDGALSGEVLSNPSTGVFSITTSDTSKHYAVVHDVDAWITYLPFNGDNNSTLFYEWGGKSVTPYGNAKVSTAQYAPLAGNTSSAYFDGTGDYLTLPASSDFAFGTADFTIEGWVRLDSLGVERAIFDNRAATTDTGLYGGVNASNQLFAFGNNATIATGTTTALTATTWHHIAVVKSSGTLSLYLNGALVGSVASSYAMTCPGALVIGRKLGSTTNDFVGFLDDLRISKGVARYVGTFTPPTQPHFTVQEGDPWWNNVVLGCHFDGQPDNGDEHRNSVVLNMRGNTLTEDTGKVVTAYGNAAVTTVSGRTAFGGKALSFDGTNSYLTIPDSSGLEMGAGAFTIEFWANPTANGGALFGKATANGWGMLTLETNSSGYLVLQGSLNGSTWALAITASSTLPLSTWSHVAVTRSADVYRLYVNGTQVGTQTLAGTLIDQATAFNIGRADHNVPRYFSGFIDDLRITKGAARYTGSTYTVPTAEIPALQRSFPDVAGGKVLTANGDVKIVSTQSKFGGYSAYFDGNGDFLTIGSSGVPTDMQIGTGDWTIDFWVYTLGTGVYSVIGNLRNENGGGHYWLHLNQTYTGQSTVLFCGGGTNLLFGSATMTINTWHHVAVVRKGTTLRCYLDGTQLGVDRTLADFTGDYTVPFTIGSTLSSLAGGTYTNFLNGYLDDLRVTKGVARWVSDFTPPNAAFYETLQTYGQQNALIYDHLTPV